MEFPQIDTSTWFYENCKRQRKNAAKICQVCPFRAGIEIQEKERHNQRLQPKRQSRVSKSGAILPPLG